MAEATEPSGGPQASGIFSNPAPRRTLGHGPTALGGGQSGGRRGGAPRWRIESEGGHEWPKLRSLPGARKPAGSSVTPRPAVHWGMGRLLWVGVSLVGAAAWGVIALHRGET